MIVKLNRKVREHVILMLHEKRRHTNMLLEESGRGGGLLWTPNLFPLFEVDKITNVMIQNITKCSDIYFACAIA